MRLARAKNTAGAAAQRWGWSLNRTDSTVNNAQPRANASSTTLVRTFSFAGINGAAMSTRATTSPVANDAATINPIPALRVDGGVPGCRWSLSWAVV
jgi:hypothetical protein